MTRQAIYPGWWRDVVEELPGALARGSARLVRGIGMLAFSLIAGVLVLGAAGILLVALWEFFANRI